MSNSKNYYEDITTAFDLLLEVIQLTYDAITEEISELIGDNLYEEAKSRAEEANQLLELHEKVSNLLSDFLGKDNKARLHKAEHKRLPRGKLTPIQAYRIPILESLVELGGTADSRDVLDKVFEKMGPRLNEYDKSLNASGIARWETYARWCRQKLVDEGLLKADSPHGTWEITPKGRNYLDQHKKSSQ